MLFSPEDRGRFADCWPFPFWEAVCSPFLGGVKAPKGPPQFLTEINGPSARMCAVRLGRPRMQRCRRVKGPIGCEKWNVTERCWWWHYAPVVSSSQFFGVITRQTAEWEGYCYGVNGYEQCAATLLLWLKLEPVGCSCSVHNRPLDSEDGESLRYDVKSLLSSWRLW